jgi:CBS domain-containing protein
VGTIKYWTVILLLILLPTATALERVVVTENGEVNLDFEESKDEELAFRCFLPPSVLQALPGSKLSIEGGGLVGGGGGGGTIDITNQEGETTTTGRTGSGTSGAGSAGSGAAPPEFNTGNFLQDVVHGQIVENGIPIGGERVNVTWIDGKNESHWDVVVTLTKEEAGKIGMPQLEGYYFLYTPPSLGFTRIIKIERLGPDSEEELIIETPTIVQKEKKGPLTKEVPIVQKERSAFEQISQKTGNYVKEHPFIIAAVALLVLALIGLVIIGLLAKQKMREIVLKALMHQQQNRMTKEMRKLLKRPVKELLSDEQTIVKPHATLRTALGSMLHEMHRVALVAEEGEYRGVVTAKDILSLEMNTSLDQRHVQEAMRNVAPLNPTAEFHQLLTLLAKEEVVPIVKEKRLLGAITREQLLQVMDEFFSMHIVEARGMPRVRQLRVEAITADEEENIARVLEKVGEKVDLIMIAKTKVDDGTYTKRLEGIVTAPLLLDEVYNYAGTLEKMEIGRLQEKSTRGLTEGTTLLEANKVLLERKMTAIPVLANGLIVGMVTEASIIDALRRYFKKLLDQNP